MAEDLADRVFSEYVIKKEIVDEETLASNSSTVTHSTSEFTSDASVNKKKQLANGHCVQHCENDTPRQTNNNNLKDSACKNTRSHSVPFSKNGKKMPNGNEERMVPAKWSKFKPVLNRIRNSDSLRAQKKTREQSPCHISSRRRRKLLPWYSYTVMLLIYIAYLFLGAVVFSFLESKAEEAKCKEAKRQVSVQKSDFSKKYFYIFGLNFKFCKGIQMYKANSDPAQLALDASYVKYFDKWLSSNCSKPAETKIWNEIQGKNETFMKRYIEIWKSISKTVLADSFNDEILVVSGATIKSVLQRTAQFGINNFLALQNDCTHNWNFHNSFFFAGTVATTIGYGSITPVTEEGKLFCIVFTIIGIPYFAYMIGSLADLIGSAIDKFKKSLKLPSKVITYGYLISGTMLMIVIPAKIFQFVEGWTFLDAIYFIIISLTTIGFGDFLPRNDPPDEDAKRIRNETACLYELINPVPSKDVNKNTGLSKLCDPSDWPVMIQAYYSIYRMSVFFWILMGLTWIGGVISMISDNFQNSFDAVKEGTDACNIQKCNETLSLLNRLDAKFCKANKKSRRVSNVQNHYQRFTYSSPTRFPRVKHNRIRLIPEARPRNLSIVVNNLSQS